MMHGAELADARAAVWQSAASRLLEVRDDADGLVYPHVRRSRCTLAIISMTAIVCPVKRLTANIATHATDTHTCTLG